MTAGEPRAVLAEVLATAHYDLVAPVLTEDEYRQMADLVIQRLGERGFVVQPPLWRIRLNEQDERRAARKASVERALARAIPYAGRVKTCQANKYPARGAPYRCANKATKATRVANHGSWSGRVIAVCSTCARNEDVSPYTGWGGDPHPNIGRVEDDVNPPAIEEK